MKNFEILECKNLPEISQELYNFLKDNKHLQRTDIRFWNFLDKDSLYSLTKKCTETMTWFKKLNLRVREGSFTIWNDTVYTTPHVDAPPVIAKINIPLLNTKNTFNVWFNERGEEIDRVECVYPIVLRSNVLHTVEVSPDAVLPRIQISFNFYNEPIKYLE